MSTLAPPEQRDSAPPGRDLASLIGRRSGDKATDWLLAAGAAIMALAFAVATLQALSLRPAALPAFFVAGALFPLILMRPAWIVPIFLGVTWMSIGQSFFGGLSPPTLGAMVLLPLAFWYARSRPIVARETFAVFLLFALPLAATTLLAENGTSLGSDPYKDLAFLAIAALCVRTIADSDRTALALVLTAIFLGLGAMYSVQVGPTALFPIDQTRDIYGNLPTGAPRAAGPFGESNFFALSLAVLTPFCLYLIAQGGRRMWLGLFGVVAIIGGDFAAQSRGGALAIAFAIVVLGFASKQRRMRAAAAAIVVLGVILALVFSAQVENANERDVSGRATENQIAVRMFLDHPLVGVGPESYPFYYRDYSRRYGNDPRYERHPHSLPLQIAAEQGIVGILGWLGAFVVLFRFAVVSGLWRDPLGRAIAVSIATYWVGSLFLHGSQNRLLFILAGLLLAHAGALLSERNRARTA
jgi:O-antigen ligase